MKAQDPVCEFWVLSRATCGTLGCELGARGARADEEVKATSNVQPRHLWSLQFEEQPTHLLKKKL